MKKIFKRLSVLFLLSLFVLAVPFTLAACDDEPVNPGGGDQPIENGTVSYTVYVKSVGGMPLADVVVGLYEGDLRKDTITTDEDGMGFFRAKPAEYEVRVIDYPVGYATDTQTHALPENGGEVTIYLESSIIESPIPAGTLYKKGDIVYDYATKAYSLDENDLLVEEDVSISGLMQEYKAVMINFFYTDCPPCRAEFPFMEEAYQDYDDRIAILAITHNDSPETTAMFRQDNGLSFLMATDSTYYGHYGVTGFPTSVMIDRYGVICEIEVGSIPDANKFRSLFDKYTSDDYVQTVRPSTGDGEEEAPVIIKPTYTMPDSTVIEEVLNADGFNGTYAPETGADAEYSWPFILSEDGQSVHPSNQTIDSSYSIMYLTFTATKDQVLTFDYLTSTEEDYDVFYVVVDGLIMAEISGVSEEWQTCYAYVPVRDGTHEVGFVYQKDYDSGEEDDTVFMKNMRLEDASLIQEPTYFSHHAASVFNEEEQRYEHYVSPVYNSTDKYWHVGSAEGPLLLANLLTVSHFSSMSVYEYYSEGLCVFDGTDYSEEVLAICQVAGNAVEYGYHPVTNDVRALLKMMTEEFGQGNANEWLEFCIYFEAHGTNEQFADPIKGLSFTSAYTAVETTEADPDATNVVNVDRMVIPRGFYYKFVPERDGVYLIQSHASNNYTTAWLRGPNEEWLWHDEGDKWGNSNGNFCFEWYMEEGVAYYVQCTFWYPTDLGTFEFTIEYVTDAKTVLRDCSTSGLYTFIEETGELTVDSVIEVYMDSEGYYRKGTAATASDSDSYIYVDFCRTTWFESHRSIENMLNVGEESGIYVFDFTEVQNDTQEYGPDRQNYMKTKLAEAKQAENGGFVKADRMLVETLQWFTDVYGIAGVNNAWLLMAYYEDYLGPQS